MFQSFSNSWDLVKASARVLWSDKELLVFPIVSALGVAAVSVVFVIPMFLGSVADALFSSDILGGIVGFLYYVVIYTIIFFANTALVGAALIRLRGGNPTLGDGIGIAVKNFFPILGYALMSATVGIILNSLARRQGALGRMVINLVGLAWNIATYLVVPILAVEGVGPMEAVKRSAKLLKKTWGEQIVGNFGIGSVVSLIFVGITFLGIGAVVLGLVLQLPGALIAVLVALVVAAFILMGLISSTLSGIYTAAVYQYAADGKVGGFFPARLVKEAFAVRA